MLYAETYSAETELLPIPRCTNVSIEFKWACVKSDCNKFNIFFAFDVLLWRFSCVIDFDACSTFCWLYISLTNMQSVLPFHLSHFFVCHSLFSHIPVSIQCSFSSHPTFETATPSFNVIHWIHGKIEEKTSMEWATKWE